MTSRISRQPANDDVGNPAPVSLAGLLCAYCGGEAVEGIALFDTPERRVVALHAPKRAAAAAARPWDGRVWT